MVKQLHVKHDNGNQCILKVFISTSFTTSRYRTVDKEGRALSLFFGPPQKPNNESYCKTFSFSCSIS